MSYVEVTCHRAQTCTVVFHEGEGLFDQLVNQDIVSFIIFNNKCINHSEKLVGCVLA